MMLELTNHDLDDQKRDYVTGVCVTFGVTPTVRVFEDFASLRARRQRRRRRISRHPSNYRNFFFPPRTACIGVEI
jgi:hypothetical protein